MICSAPWNWLWPASGTPRHNRVQQYEDGTAAWLHAVLHKMEGDLGNSRYWYRRTDRMDRVAEGPRTELAAVLAELALAIDRATIPR